VLGKVMPFWYIAALVMLIVAAVITSGEWLVTVAAVLMAMVVLLTVTMLVPINNRIGAWTDAADRDLARRWDRLHWLRVGLLVVVLVLLGAGALNASHQHHDDGEKVKVLSTTDIKEKLDGKEAVATVVEVTIEPGRSGVPHRHLRIRDRVLDDVGGVIDDNVEEDLHPCPVRLVHQLGVGSEVGVDLGEVCNPVLVIRIWLEMVLL
jgi:hypothetical protein